jgi:hypothetical protein
VASISQCRSRPSVLHSRSMCGRNIRGKAGEQLSATFTVCGPCGRARRLLTIHPGMLNEISVPSLQLAIAQSLRECDDAYAKTLERHFMSFDLYVKTSRAESQVSLLSRDPVTKTGAFRTGPDLPSSIAVCRVDRTCVLADSAIRVGRRHSSTFTKMPTKQRYAAVG